MFVFRKYNLKSDYMYFIPTSDILYVEPNTNITLLYCVSFLIIVSLAFYFRESISAFKETTKHQLRGYLKPLFVKVDGDSVSTAKEGTMQFIWEYLDTYFLTPSDSSFESFGDIDDDNDDDDESDDGDQKKRTEGMETLESENYDGETDNED